MTKVSKIQQEQQESGSNTRDMVTARIERGQSFIAFVEDTSVADAGTLSILLTPDPQGPAIPKLVISGAVGGDARAEFFESPTVSAAGSAVPVVNRNRVTPTLATLAVTLNPTVTDDGVEELYNIFVPGGEGRKESPGSVTALPLHWLLDRNKTYFIRFTNLAGSVQPLAIQVDFIEDPDPVLA